MPAQGPRPVRRCSSAAARQQHAIVLISGLGYNIADWRQAPTLEPKKRSRGVRSTVQFAKAAASAWHACRLSARLRELPTHWPTTYLKPFQRLAALLQLPLRYNCYSLLIHGNLLSHHRAVRPLFPTLQASIVVIARALA